MREDRRLESDAEKWETQLRKGCLELAVLASLLDRHLYGLEIIRRLQDLSDLVVSEGTVYPLLSRLKALGLVRSEWVESNAGPPRKYYGLTAAGKRRVSEMAASWERFAAGIEKLLGPVGKGKA